MITLDQLADAPVGARVHYRSISSSLAVHYVKTATNAWDRYQNGKRTDKGFCDKYMVTDVDWYVLQKGTEMTDTDSKELAEYKQRVRKAAEAAGKKHGWCDEIQNILFDLDIPRAKTWKVGDLIDHVETDGLPPGTQLISSAGRNKYIRLADKTTYGYIHPIRVSGGLWSSQYFIEYIPEGK